MIRSIANSPARPVDSFHAHCPPPRAHPPGGGIATTSYGPTWGDREFLPTARRPGAPARGGHRHNFSWDVVDASVVLYNVKLPLHVSGELFQYFFDFHTTHNVIQNSSEARRSSASDLGPAWELKRLRNGRLHRHPSAPSARNAGRCHVAPPCRCCHPHARRWRGLGFLSRPRHARLAAAVQVPRGPQRGSRRDLRLHRQQVR